jgi:hypothetical protein
VWLHIKTTRLVGVLTLRSLDAIAPPKVLKALEDIRTVGHRNMEGTYHAVTDKTMVATKHTGEGEGELALLCCDCVGVSC